MRGFWAARPAGPVSTLREQASLKTRVVDRDTEAWQRDPAFSGLQRVGGVDVSFVKDDSGSACASLVVLSYPELEVTPLGRGRTVGSPGALVREAGLWTGNSARVEPRFSSCGSSLINWKAFEEKRRGAKTD